MYASLLQDKRPGSKGLGRLAASVVTLTADGRTQVTTYHDIVSSAHAQRTCHAQSDKDGTKRCL